MAISTEDSQYHSSELIKDLRTYRPKYPLPEDLRNIRTEETFCAYCGVSYLILNEIKFLEDKSENLRKELEIVKQKQGFNSLIPIGDADLPSSGEKQVSEDIERLLNEKAEITQKLDDMNTKLICYEATEKQFIKELARSQAEVSFAQEKLIELFDYSKRIRNKLKEKLFTDSLLRPIFDRINSLRDHISTLNQSYNISFTQLNNQYNQITNKLDLVTLEKDSAINKFNELELKYKEERNNWSEKQGEQLGDILVLKTKLNEETKRLDTLHDEKRQLILNFEKRTIFTKEMTNMSEELTSIKKTNEQLDSALETSKQEILELKTITTEECALKPVDGVEVKQLYATVEKECWERDELNSVLAETREQLMKLSNSSKQSESDHRQSNQQENQKDDHLFPSISSSSVKSEQFIKHTVPKSSKTSNSNNGIARRSFQNFKNTKDTSGLAATQRQIATIISATKFRCQ
ncbi:elongation factor 2 kinase, putative [Schistosoma mansoni]|uniref:elongation factor 2 kinase, putative n=1 Tax=Schistosoma mansoni TaxID=6183 RepID=UPI00022C84FC|nr:elongation factor 2 kinase, putative [Schistosoma mansoni]|eukprot:XP_018646168.1 elongation factor 2 kinase, putative [Schistosoma mansoni]